MKTVRFTVAWLLRWFAMCVLYREFLWRMGLYPMWNWCMLAWTDLRHGTTYLKQNREAARRVMRNKQGL